MGRSLKISIVCVVSVVATLGIFIGFVPIPSTVVASGAVTSLRAQREISHDRGGVIKSVFVLEGENVLQGQPVIELDQSVLKAELTALATEIVVLSAERESLIASDLGKIDWGYSEELRALAKEYNLEQNLHRETKRSQTKGDALSTIVDEAKSERNSLAAQLKNRTAEYRAKNDELKFLRDLLDRKGKLQKEGYATLIEIRKLKIEEASLRGGLERLKASINQLQGAIEKNDLTASRLPFEDGFERLTRIAQLSREIAEKKLRRQTVLEALSKSVVAAPVSGQVIELSVNTVGGFVSPGQPIVAIAPAHEHMIIEAKFQPRDIHAVSPGMAAKVVFPTFPQREMLELSAEIESIATDVIVDERTGETHYVARLRIPQEILDTADQRQDRAVYSGLPVEIYLTVDRTTIFSYLLKPIKRSMRKTFRA